MSAPVVAFTGPMGAGKSTAARLMCERLGYAPTKFAGPLKDMMRAFYATAGLEPVEAERRIEGDLKEAPDDLLEGRTPRHAMQTLGTEWGRELIAPTLWISAWSRGAAVRIAAGERLVVDDARFENEAAAVRSLGGVVVELVGRGAWGGSHKSEAGVRPDFTIDNTRDAEALACGLIYIFGSTDR